MYFLFTGRWAYSLHGGAGGGLSAEVYGNERIKGLASIETLKGGVKHIFLCVFSTELIK